MLSMAASKMSKSLGNVVSVGELLDQGHQGEVLRYALLTAHYRQPLDWSPQLVAQSKATLDRLYRAAGDAAPGALDPAVLEALADDLNTPLALSRLSAIDDGPTLRASAALLGLLGDNSETWFRGEGDARVDALDCRALRSQAAPRLRRGRPHPRRAGPRRHRARGRGGGHRLATVLTSPQGRIEDVPSRLVA